jgi:hypothetical protein
MTSQFPELDIVRGQILKAQAYFVSHYGEATMRKMLKQSLLQLPPEVTGCITGCPDKCGAKGSIGPVRIHLYE